MIIAKNDENKRSTLWKAATLVSSVLIVLIAVYLLTKLFTSNPLEGSWEDEDGSFRLTIKKNDTVIVTVSELSDDGADVMMHYVLDRKEKTISIHPDDGELLKLSQESDGQYTKEDILRLADPVITTFNYSVDKSCLTLTEREYGEQMEFLKK